MTLPAPVLTTVAFAVALGVLVFVHELGHFLVAKRVGVKVDRFSIGFGPVLLSWRRDETEYALSAVPLGGYVKMQGEDDEEEAAADPARSFSTQSPLRRGAIVAAGPAMNFVFAFLMYFVLFASVGAEVPSPAPRVGGVAQGSPAEHSGLEIGDTIVTVDARAITTWDELSKAVTASGGQALRLEVERADRRFPVDITPELRTDRNLFGEEGDKVYRIGIEASRDWVEVGVPEAVRMAGVQTWTASSVVAKGLGLMLRGRVPLRELGGPIAIARAAGQQARAGLKYFLSMLAFLSVNLGVLNLLPVPALDGGHIALLGVEGVMRQPLRKRHRELAQQVGLVLLLTLMVFVFYNDIHRLVVG